MRLQVCLFAQILAVSHILGISEAQPIAQVKPPGNLLLSSNGFHFAPVKGVEFVSAEYLPLLQDAQLPRLQQTRLLW